MQRFSKEQDIAFDSSILLDNLIHLSNRNNIQIQTNSKYLISYLNDIQDYVACSKNKALILNNVKYPVKRLGIKGSKIFPNLSDTNSQIIEERNVESKFNFLKREIDNLKNENLQLKERIYKAENEFIDLKTKIKNMNNI
ncbi:unnamed protein product [Brachionus calyciflorus]|uniref:Uncharacterized protein n=1 Tax=Brachionus calyciflorus TaxID=104777 RepID=A0A814APB7_9BILA|nr:unnamed protein product [Brachionus calyciflorus]